MSQSTVTIPATQHAVQLVGPGKLEVNSAKPVVRPTGHQILAKVEAVGLCFSDLKLLKQFHDHARKSEVVRGLSAEILAGIPSYVPGDKPTVPGHEVVARIIAIGEAVTQHEVGERCLVQADYRQLKTAGSNGAFGYNFEGALQEYVLLDERVVIDTDGERFLIPVGEQYGASQIALVEPWACVEDSYVTLERQTILAGGKLLVVADAGRDVLGVDKAFSFEGKPLAVTAVLADPGQRAAVDALGISVSTLALDALVNEGYDDIIYFGADKATLEILNDKIATNGTINIVTGGKKIGAPVNVGVGRIHYGLTRWIGTTGTDASESYKMVPAMGELRDGDSILIVGAGGPMGQMHVIRDVCSGKKGISVIGTDFDQPRLDAIEKKARPMAQANGVELKMVNTKEQKLEGEYSYHALMAPFGAVVADAIKLSSPGAIVNIFAGIPAPVKHELDVDRLIENQVFVFGTSGSTIRDMKIVLDKVVQGTLNTNSSVDAISGMAGAKDGIAAVENRTLAGKIIVYPMLHDVPLIPLSELKDKFPTVAAKLTDGQWNPEAERELLAVAGAAH